MKKLNKQVQEKAEALNQWILNQDIVKEYQRYEKKIQNDEVLKALEKELKQMQQAIVKAKHLNNDCESLIQAYQKKKKSFDENPLVYNYLVLKEEVNALLNQIQNDINLELKKKNINLELKKKS